MKVMVCIPMEIDIDTYGRKESKEAVRAKLLATMGEGTEERPAILQLIPNLQRGYFLVRKPEKVPGFDSNGQPK